MDAAGTGDPTRLLHVSDTHLGYTAYDEESREADFTEAFADVISIAIDRDVDGVVHTGDITHSADWNERLPRRARLALEDLSDADIPFFFVLGNHDVDEVGREQRWAKTIVDDGLGIELGREPRRCGSVELYGVDYHDESWWEDPDLSFSAGSSTTKKVICLHQSVAPLMAASYSELTLDRLQRESSVTFDLALLGHSHYTKHYDNGELPGQYAGGTERTTRGYRDESAEVVEFTFDDSGIHKCSHELDIRPFRTYRVNYSEGVDVDTLAADIDHQTAAGSVVTAFVGSPEERRPAEQAFERAGALDAQAMLWEGETPQFEGLTEISEGDSAEPHDEVEQATDSAPEGGNPPKVLHVGAVEFGKFAPDHPQAGEPQQAFDQVIRTAIDQEVDAVVLTGALFGDTPLPDAIEYCRRSLIRLSEADVSVFSVPENEGNEPFDSMVEEQLVDVLDAAGTRVGTLSVHGLTRDQFHQKIAGVSPPDSTHGVVASTAQVSPPAPAATADWNLGQFIGLIDECVEALLLGSGSEHRSFESGRALAYSSVLVPEIDDFPLEHGDYPGSVSVLTFRESGPPQFDRIAIDAPPLRTREISFEAPPTYEEAWKKLDDLEATGAHVRLRITGAPNYVTTRINRRLETDAESVVIRDERGEVTDTTLAPGTTRGAVTAPEPSNTGSTEPESPAPESFTDPLPTGSTLRDAGVARIEDRDDGRCGFVFDVKAWQRHTDTASSIDWRSLQSGKWYCPHSAEDGTETCVFHTPPEDTDGTLERRRFHEAVETATTRRDLQFYGASLDTFSLASHEIDSAQRYPVDFRHASISEVSITHSHLHQPLRFDHAEITDSIHIRGSQLEGLLSLSDAVVHGRVRAEFSTFGATIIGTGTQFRNGLMCKQSAFDSGFAFGDSEFGNIVRFSNCTLSGHSTFYDANFHRHVQLRRNRFGLECRLDGATFHDDLTLYQSRFDQLLGLDSLDVKGAFAIEESTVAGPLQLTDATVATLSITDTDCRNTLRCERSTVNRLDWSHVDIDGQTRFIATEFDEGSLVNVTFGDSVKLIGDSPGSQATPATVSGEWTVSDSIFDRTLAVSNAVFDGDCAFTDCAFRDGVTFDGVTTAGSLGFDQTNIDGRLVLDGTVNGALSLDRVACSGQVDTAGIDSVDGPLDATGAAFGGELKLDDTVFYESVDFSNASVGSTASFQDIEVCDRAVLDDATFDGPVNFSGSTFGDDLSADSTTFDDESMFQDVVVGGDGEFNDARFTGPAQFVGTEFHGSARFDHVRFADTARFAGLRCLEDATFENVSFAHLAGFPHATVDGEFDAAHTEFNGTAQFDDAQIGGPVTFEAATFAREASFERVTVTNTESLTLDTAEFSRGLNLEDATLGGELSADAARFSGTTTFDCLSVTDDCSFARARFDGETSLVDASISGRLTFEEGVFGRSLDLSSVTVTTGSMSLDGTRLRGPARFDEITVDSSTTAVDARFDGIVSFEDADFGGEVTFNGTNFEETVRFAGTSFGSDVGFRDVDVANLRFEAESERYLVDCTDATLHRGMLRTGSDGGPLFDLTRATVGDIRLRGVDGEPEQYTAYRLVLTNYDGFQFAEHSGLRESERSLEAFDLPEATEPDPNTLETTYLNAKNGASAVGDSVSEGEFFSRELTHRRATHRKAGRWKEFTMNLLFEKTADYGQSPYLVFLTSARMVAVFGLVFAALMVVFPSMATGLDGIYTGPFGVSLLSLEAFTTLVFGGANVPSQSLRLLGAIEGFFGAFLVALFLYALTQSVDR